MEGGFRELMERWWWWFGWGGVVGVRGCRVGLVVFWVVFGLRLRVVWSLLAEEMAKPPKIPYSLSFVHAVPESEIKEKKITIGYVYNLTIRVMDFTFFRTYCSMYNSTTLLYCYYTVRYIQLTTTVFVAIGFISFCVV
jgi:hypothetical protein